MIVRTIDLKTVTLIPHNLYMEQAADMNLFTITHQSLHYTDPGDHKKGVKMVLVMKRKITSEMMTTFFPTLLLMLITFATTFFKPFFFEAALSVNLTTMLVMTNIFISKMEGLPPTSDTKMIDYWLILCQLVPFAEVVLLTAKEYLREEEDSYDDNVTTKNETINKKGYPNVIHVSIDEGATDHEEPHPDDDECSKKIDSTFAKKRGLSATNLKVIGRGSFDALT